MKKYINIQSIILFTLVVLLFSTLGGRGKDSANFSHLPIRVFRFSGEVPLGAPRIFNDTITPTSSNGYTIDLSAAGFTQITGYQVSCMRNNSTAVSTPNVAVKSITNTSMVVNITEGNNSTVVILGIPVLSGPPIQFVADPSSIKLSILVTGK